MSAVTIIKALAGAEDISLGMATEVQQRGTITQLNSGVLPYSETETTTQAIDRKSDVTYVDAQLATKANLNGDATQPFLVSSPIDNSDAVRLIDLNSGLSAKADQTYVDGELLLKADESNVMALDGSTGAFTPIDDFQPANKGYVDTRIIEAGAGDMLKSVYDTDISGAVDFAEGVGVAGSFLGVAPASQVMKLSQSNVTNADTLDDFGIFIGTDVVNAPTNGQIAIEQMDVSGAKAQRCYSYVTNSWYYRKFDTLWTAWEKVPDTLDITVQDYTTLRQAYTVTETNLNDMLTGGYYAQTSGVLATLVNNYPVENGTGTLEVTRLAPDSVVHTYITRTSPSRGFIRSLNGAVWSTWVELADKALVDTKFDKAGGDITGRVDLTGHISPQLVFDPTGIGGFPQIVFRGDPVDSYPIATLFSYTDLEQFVMKLSNPVDNTTVNTLTMHNDGSVRLSEPTGTNTQSITRKDYVDGALATKAALQATQTVFGGAKIYRSGGTAYINTI